MKNIMLSIQPKWAAMILNGTKTVEIRKSAPKPPFTVWMYVTKAEPYLRYIDGTLCQKTDSTGKWGVDKEDINGKVVAKFVVEKVTKFSTNDWWDEAPISLEETRLEYEALRTYGNGKTLYAWHITALEIIEPMELKEFKFDGKVYNYAFHAFEEVPVTMHRPPQSWQYVIPPKEEILCDDGDPGLTTYVRELLVIDESEKK